MHSNVGSLESQESVEALAFTENFERTADLKRRWNGSRVHKSLIQKIQYIAW